MSKPKLTDPVKDKIQDIEEKQEELEEKSFDISNLKLSDFKTLSAKIERASDPFDGYPHKKEMIGDTEFDLTHLVVLRPNEQPPQDPSGENLTIEQEKNIYKDGIVVKKQKLGSKIVTIKTTHNRCLKSFYDGKNYDVVFDRELKLSDGTVLDSCAIIPDNSLRAQVCFMIEPRTGKTLVDRRYMLPDMGQAKRLRRVFNDVSYNKLKASRAASKFDAAEES